MRMRKGIKLLNESSEVIRSGGKLKNPNRSVRYSRLHDTQSIISLSSLDPSELPVSRELSRQVTLESEQVSRILSSRSKGTITSRHRDSRYDKVRVAKPAAIDEMVTPIWEQRQIRRS